MGVSIYYDYYSPECNNEKVLPYLKRNTNAYDDCDDIPEQDHEIYVAKDNQEEFFKCLRDHSTEYEKPHCFVITSMTELFNFLCDVKDICSWIPEGLEDGSFPDLVTWCIIIWVM